MAVPLVLRVPDPGEVRGAVVRVARHHALHPVPELRPGPLELVVPVSPMIRPLQYGLRGLKVSLSCVLFYVYQPTDFT